jgi:hypothetical protein
MSSRECFRRQLAIVAPLLCLLNMFAMAQLPVGVNVSCAIVGGDVTLNGPVIPEFSVGNRLPETIVVDFGGHNDREFRISMTRPDGSVAGPANRSTGRAVMPPRLSGLPSRPW